MNTTAALDAEPKVTIYELPQYWQNQIRKLKAENQKMRQERNDYRDRLKAIEELMPWKAAHEPGTTA